MRVFLKILAWTVGVVVVAVGGLLLYLRNADLNTYEALIEETLSDAIGLQVDFDGRFELRFGRVSTVSAENISLVNASVDGDSQVLSIESFDVAVDTWSLIARPVVIEDLSIGGADITLVRDSQGRGNWAPADGFGASDAAPQDDSPAGLDLVVLRRVDLAHVRFTLNDPARAGQVRAIVNGLTVVPQADGMLDIDLDGSIGDHPLRADGSIGPLEGLVAAGAVSANLQATLGQMQVSVAGTVAELRHLSSVSVTISAGGPEIGRLIEAFALPPFAEGAFAVDIGITPDAAGNAVLVDGNIGTIELSLDGTVDDLLAPRAVSLNYAFAGPESAYIAGLFGVEDATRAAFDVSGGFDLQDERYVVRNADIALGRSRLEVDGWVKATGGIPEIDMRIRGQGPDLAVFDPFVPVDGIPAEPYDISGRFMREGDTWQFENLVAEIGDIRIAANGRTDGAGGPENRISVSVAGPDLSALRVLSGVPQLPAAPFDVTGDLRGAQGGIRIESAAAKIQGNRIDASGFVSTAERGSGTELEFRLRGPALAGIAALSEAPYLPKGEFDIAGKLRIEPAQILLSGITATADDLMVRMDGRVSRAAAERTIDFFVNVEGQDLSGVLPYPPIQRLGRESFRVYGDVTVTGQMLAVRDLHAVVGNFDIETDATLDLSNLLASDRIEIHAAAPDPSMIQTLAGLGYLPGGTFALDVNIDTTERTYVISDSGFQIGDFRLDLSGEVGKSRPYFGNDVSVLFTGPSLREIGLVFDDQYMADEPFSLEAHLDGTETGFDMDAFDFKVGISEVGGAMTVDVSGERPQIEVTFDSPLLDFRDRIPRWIEESDSGETDVAATEDGGGGGRVFSDEPLDLPWTEIADVRLDIDIDRLLLPTEELTDFHFDVEMTEGSVVVDRLEMSSPTGGVSGRFSLTEERGIYSVSAALDIDGIRPLALAAEGLDPGTVPPIDVDVRFDGEGESPHDIVGGGDGYVFIFVEPGQVAVIGAQFFSGGLIEGIARTINPLAKPRTFTAVECGIADIDIVNGLAQFTQVAVQTGQLTIVSSGTVNLDTERLKLTVRTLPREGISLVSLSGIVNPYVRVAGTLAAPTLEIDPAGSAGAAGAAVATGGLSVLARGLWDRIRGGSDMCRNLPRERPDRSE